MRLIRYIVRRIIFSSMSAETTSPVSLYCLISIQSGAKKKTDDR